MKKYEWRCEGENHRLDGSRYWLKKKRGRSYIIMSGDHPYNCKPGDLEGSKNLVEALEGMIDADEQ